VISSEEIIVDRRITMASHSHTRAQLTLAVAGAFQVEAANGTWTIPSNCAAWIPPDLEHAERLTTGSRLRTLRIDPALVGSLPAEVRTLRVGPLLREIVSRFSEIGGLADGVPEQSRLAQVLVDEIRSAASAALELAAPRDHRALRAARIVEDNPGDRCSVAELATRAGVNRRTLERLFMADLGMSVGEWRQRLRLHGALRLLAEQRPVGEIALASGYGSAPAFIAVFKRHFGVTPHQYRRPAAHDGPKRPRRAR
jgi:AraC-like DNA-binding protein